MTERVASSSKIQLRKADFGAIFLSNSGSTAIESSKDRYIGGHLFIPANSTSFIENCNFTESDADEGTFLYLTDSSVISLIESHTIQNIRGYTSIVSVIGAATQLKIENSTFKFNHVTKGSIISYNYGISKMKNVTFLNNTS